MKKTVIIICFAIFIIAIVVVFALSITKDPEPAELTPMEIAIKEATEDRHTYADNGLYLILRSDNEGNEYYEVSGIGECKASRIVIPSNHNGIPIKKIGDFAFYNCTFLETISIPDTATITGLGSFSGCTNLKYNRYEGGSYLGNKDNPYMILITYYGKTPKIHEDTRVIAEEAFKGKSYSSIPLPEGIVSICDWAFTECAALKEITIPDSVTYLGNCAFVDCQKLEAVTLGKGITALDTRTFGSCSSLKSVVFLGDLENTGTMTFNECTSLEYIEFPETLKKIGHYLFEKCSSLKKVILHPGIEEIGGEAFPAEFVFDRYGSVNYVGNEDDPYLYAISLADEAAEQLILHPETYAVSDEFLNSRQRNFSFAEIEGGNGIYLRSSGNCLIRKDDGKLIYGISSSIIPSDGSVLSIGDYAFYSCPELTEVIIPDSVTEIGEYAFSNSEALASVTIADSVKEIGTYAFDNCESLVSVSLPNTITKIPAYCFHNCKLLAQIIIPESVEEIDFGAFYYCFALTRISLRNVKIINSDAFSSCMALESVELSDELGFIGHRAFYWCTSLSDINLPISVIYIGDKAFGGTAITELKLPPFLKYYYSSYFDGCEKLTSAALPRGVETITGKSFYNCSALTEIYLPATVKTIMYGAFSACASLNKIYFDGTLDEWNAIVKEEKWYISTSAFTVICQDGDIEYAENSDEYRDFNNW